MKGRPAEATRDAWLLAGQTMLRTEGLKALKLRPLAAAMGISTGSFYHHFKDFDAYLGDLAAYYSGEQLSRNLADIRARAPSPAARIQVVQAFAREQDLAGLALAMRAWANSDPRARASVRATDAALIAFFSECLEAMGFAPPDAVARAYLLLVTATGDVEVPEDLPHRATLRERVVKVILGSGD